MVGKRSWMLLGVAALALINGSGCLAVVAGTAAAGAGAAGYAYVKGRFYRDYPSSVNDAFTAVRAGLTELRFPIVREDKGTGKAMLESKTADGTNVTIDLDTLISRIPSEGQVTRVYIRVGAFGDEAVSARIFDQANLHLVPQGPVKIGPPTVGVPATAPVSVAGGLRPGETGAPPLAGSVQPTANWTPQTANPVKLPTSSPPPATK